jgi:hypothetical protein
MHEIEVSDLYEGAWLLVSGNHLERLERLGRDEVLFIISGEHVGVNLEDFRAGRASVNIALYLFTLEKLKDRLFGMLRGGGK